MGKPAARVTDMHTCPMVTVLVPHVGGPILPPCSMDTLIGFLPAARVTDMATCVGPPDVIAQGSPTVLINYLQAARMGDMTVHGGVIVTGFFPVLIGESGSGGAGGMGGSAPSAEALLAAEIERRLDEAGYLSKDDVARQIVSELSDDDIKNMPAATRNRLMEELYAGYYSDADKEAMARLYSVKFVDPEFEAIDRAHRAEMVEKFKTDPDLQNAKANWATMSQEDRTAAAQKAADIQAETYGFPKTTVTTYDKAPYKDSSGRELFENGYYNHSDGELHLNTHSGGGRFNDFDNFNSVMDTVTHENAHRQQNTMADAYNAGEIKPGDPNYEQARTFAINDNTYIHEPFETYSTQPMENHSRTTGAAGSGAFQ